MIDVDSAADYLLAEGLIERDAIIDGNLTIRSASRRNRNLRVETTHQIGYLLKQPYDPDQGALTLRREAQFYALCQQELAVEACALPRLVAYDDRQPLLVLELFLDAIPLHQEFRARTAPDALVGVMRAVGANLGTAHTAFRRLAHAPGLAWLSHERPWVLSANKPALRLLATLSAANYQALRILQSQECLGERLSGLSRDWQPDTVIHNDLKADNILILPPRPEREQRGPDAVRLVDWELVALGDPAWDVAAGLQNLVLFWLSSMPLQEALDVSQLAEAARCPWPTLQSAARAFWDGYRGAACLATADADRFLVRAVGFSGAWLIQSAYELSQFASRLPKEAVLMLQISANVLKCPAAARRDFYALP